MNLVNIVNPLKGFFSSLIAPISNVFIEREQTKQAKVSANAKAAMAKQNGITSVTLTEQEWEAIVASSMADSWKDEYVTIVITSPIVLIILGCIYFAFTESRALLDAATLAIDTLNEIGVPMAALMQAVVYAAIGLKVWRAK